MVRFAALVLFTAFVATAGFAQETPWEEAKNEDGIIVYTRKVEGSKIKAFKAEMVLNASITDVLAVLLEPDEYHTWYHNVSHSRRVKRISDTEGIYYSQFDSPWPVRDRDNVIHFSVTYKDNDQVVIRQQIAKDHDIEKVKKFVRVEELVSSWTVTPLANGQTKVIHEAHVEPGGTIPAWAANAFVTETPMETFKNLREKF